MCVHVIAQCTECRTLYLLTMSSPQTNVDIRDKIIVTEKAYHMPITAHSSNGAQNKSGAQKLFPTLLV